VGFVVDKVELGQASQGSSVFPANIIPPGLSILIRHLEEEQQARWWPQFRDMVLSHQCERQDLNHAYMMEKRKRMNFIKSFVTEQTVIELNAKN
jgi:hypothetical protein